MKKFIIIVSTMGGILSFSGLLIIISVTIGFFVGKETEAKEYQRLEVTVGVKNNGIYAERYRDLVEKYLKKDGYVTLERLVFYLQRTKNVLDITSLSNEEWEHAYLSNIDLEKKQMIPIKTVCNNLNTMNLPEYTITSGLNKDNIEIDKIDLCTFDKTDITTLDKFSEIFVELPYTSPFQNDISYQLTSMVFENRNVEFGLSQAEQSRVNYHSGWDLAVPIGTDVRSICDGRIINIVMTQANDLSYDKQSGIKNQTGNYVQVECNNGYIAQYWHVKYNSVYGNKKVGDSINKGELLVKTSTTGLSTGPHLHLGLKTKEGTQLDAFSYIDFANES